MIGKQVLAFGKSEKSEFINIGIFAATSGGRKGRNHIRRFTPDRERSPVWFSVFLYRACDQIGSLIFKLLGRVG